MSWQARGSEMNHQQGLRTRNHHVRKVLAAAFSAVMLSVGLSSAVVAAEQSGCVTCHLDESMLVKNLSEAKVKKSAMQSGAG